MLNASAISSAATLRSSTIRPTRSWSLNRRFHGPLVGRAVMRTVGEAVARGWLLALEAEPVPEELGAKRDPVIYVCVG